MRSLRSRVETASPCRARTPRFFASSGSLASSQKRAHSSRSNALGGVGLRHLPLAIQHLALGGPPAIGEDSPEEQERLALERVAAHHRGVLELDDQRVDVDLVALEQELARLADWIALAVELGESDARARMAAGDDHLIEHHEPGAPLRVPEEP